MKHNFSTQIIARVALWGFLLAIEILAAHTMKEWRNILGHYETYIAITVVIFIATLCLGKSNLVAGFRDLALYDVAVQCVGWYTFHYGFSLNLYLTLNYSLLTLKFLRLLWPLRTKDTKVLLNWPVIGPFSFLQAMRAGRSNEEAELRSPKGDKIAYISIALTIPIIFAIRAMGIKMPPAFWALIGALLLVRYFKPFMAYSDKRETEFIENEAKAAVLDATEAKNAELRATNLELDRARADAERAREEAVQARQEAEQARDEAERAKANEETISRALRTGAHDLRQNIALIGFAGNDIVKASTLAERQEALKAFYDVIQKVTQAIEQIMYYAKLTTKQAEPKLEALEMCRTLFRLCNQWRNAGFEKGVELLITYPWKEGVTRYVACDPMLVNHVLQNLLINAISHAGPGCDRIIFCVRNRGDHYLVQIRDCGTGIEEGEGPDPHANFASFARRIYERDAQRGDGHGLGINIVKQMCEVAQIPIGLRSRLGKGTTFSLLIPKASAALIAATELEVAERVKARENAKLLWRSHSG